MASEIEILVVQAQGGNNTALEKLIRKIQDRVYGLAIRMLWHPEDAEDAAQEILTKIIIHLSTFRGKSKFTSWVYSIASNHLLKTRKRRAEREEITFERFEDELNQGLSDTTIQTAEDIDQELLVEEIRIGCMQGMLLCLDRDHRLTYILSEIFEISSNEGSEILNITPSAFRKRLSRARQNIRTFMKHNCGLVSTSNDCRCKRQTTHALHRGRVNPNKLLFVNHTAYEPQNIITAGLISEMDELERAAALFRTHPDYASPGVFVKNVKKLIESGGHRVF